MFSELFRLNSSRICDNICVARFMNSGGTATGAEAVDGPVCDLRTERGAMSRGFFLADLACLESSASDETSAMSSHVRAERRDRSVRRTWAANMWEIMRCDKGRISCKASGEARW